QELFEQGAELGSGHTRRLMTSSTVVCPTLNISCLVWGFRFEYCCEAGHRFAAADRTSYFQRFLIK
ncbi:MAG: hypothetical protein Q8R55_02955, partial [Candidatus Taylorbacteria bacterium]|nr:hypothetical protein [Candidatus Taylorbacteria bacterium]